MGEFMYHNEGACEDKTVNENNESVEDILARYTHLDQSDPFVGSQFPTPKGGTLTVVGWDGSSRSSNNKKFTCHCSICSEDKELFPEYFKSPKSSLISGSMSCGCSNGYRWPEEQNKIRVQRECDRRGYIFHRWSGKYKGSKTRLDLENPETGNRWDSASLTRFLLGCGDPVEGILKFKKCSTKEDLIHIQDFYNAGFTEDYKFWRSDRVDSKGGKSYWYYTCPVCSQDEYVQAGVCTGIFESRVSSLKRGGKSCRCSKNYKWAQEQREYQINKICEAEGLTFLGWEIEKGYKKHNSEFMWLCSEGHNCTTTVNSFLNGRRCKTCRDIKNKQSGNGNGYYPKRKDETDFLYVINFNNKYIKVGRAFDIWDRISKQSNSLLKLSKMSVDQLTILKILTAKHQEVYDCEQWLHEELTQRGFYHEESTWSTETFTMDCLAVLEMLLKDCDLEEVNLIKI